MTNEIFLGLLAGIPWTIVLTLLSFVAGSLLGLPLCALRLSKLSMFRVAATSLVLIFRSIPPILWIFLIYFGVGTGYLPVGPLQASVIGLGLITAANMSEIYRGALAAIHSGQWEAAEALGLPSKSRYWDVIGPQLMRISLPSAASYAVGLLKESAIASTVGVAEISFRANHIAQATYKGIVVFATAGVLYILISVPIAGLARFTDLQLRQRVSV
jgi:polar amino acid transport system permease protein